MTTTNPVQIIGEVVSPPVVRTAIDAVSQRTTPTLHLTLKVQGQPRPVLVRQTFGFGEMEGALAAARRYAAGSIVKVDADMTSIQLALHGDVHLHLLESGKNQERRNA